MPVKQAININLPGSKSYTNRALICAALADGRTRLFGFGECEDAKYMIYALKQLGVGIKNLKLKIKECLEIRGGLERLRLPEGCIYVGNAGTAMRFLASLVGLVVNKVKSKKLKGKSSSQKVKVENQRKEIILTGSKRMHDRPVRDLLEALKELGIQAESVKENGCPPVKFSIFNFQFLNKPQYPIFNIQYPVLGGKTRLKGNVSSQYLSSILLCASYFDKDTEIEIIGELTSKPYVDMTIDVMNKFGVRVDNQDYRIFKVKAGQKYQPRDYQIEPDASAASYFMAGAALIGQFVRFPGLNARSIQGDIKFVEVLDQIKDSKFKISAKGGSASGGKNCNLKLEIREDDLVFQGSGSLSGISVDMNDMTDLVPTLAVLAMFARGKTVIRNVANLRIKECDRLRALALEIKKFGIDVKEFSDGLEIYGNPKLRITNYELRIKIKTYNDHRMAMAFAIAKLVLPDIIIENPRCVSKSFPKFWQEWHKMEL